MHLTREGNKYSEGTRTLKTAHSIHIQQKEPIQNPDKRSLNASSRHTPMQLHETDIPSRKHPKSWAGTQYKHDREERAWLTWQMKYSYRGRRNREHQRRMEKYNTLDRRRYNKEENNTHILRHITTNERHASMQSRRAVAASEWERMRLPTESSGTRRTVFQTTVDELGIRRQMGSCSVGRAAIADPRKEERR